MATNRHIPEFAKIQKKRETEGSQHRNIESNAQHSDQRVHGSLGTTCSLYYSKVKTYETSIELAHARTRTVRSALPME